MRSDKHKLNIGQGLVRANLTLGNPMSNLGHLSHLGHNGKLVMWRATMFP